MVLLRAACFVILLTDISSTALIRRISRNLQYQNSSHVRRVETAKSIEFSDLKQVYNVDWNPVYPDARETYGRCGPWKDKILKAYQELQTIMQAASLAVDMLEKPYPAQAPDQGQYVQKAQAFLTMFGKLGGSAESRVELNAVKSTYNAYIQAHQHKGPPEFLLRCDDDFLQWYSAKHQDPRDHETPDEGKYSIGNPKPGRKAYPYGTFVAHGVPLQYAIVDDIWPEHMLQDFEAKPETRQNPLCGNKKFRGESGGTSWAIGFALHDNHLLVFCPSTLEEKEWSITAIQERVVEGTSPLVFKHTWALCWLHELGHLIPDWVNPPALNTDKDEIPDPRTGHVITTGDLPDARNLAYYDKKRTLTSPENYAWFATLVNTNWFWGTHDDFGSARKSVDLTEFKSMRVASGSGSGSKQGGEGWWAQPQPQPQPESPKALGKIQRLKDKSIPKKGQSSSKPNRRSIAVSDNDIGTSIEQRGA